MAIEVRRDGDRFYLSLTPPNAEAEWRSEGSLSATQVLRECARRGCHSTDVVEALDASGSDWRPAHEAEVQRNREAVRSDQSFRWVWFVPGSLIAFGLVTMFVGTYWQVQFAGSGSGACDRSIPTWLTWPLILAGGFIVAFALVFEAVQPDRRFRNAVLLVMGAVVFAAASCAWAAFVSFGSILNC